MTEVHGHNVLNLLNETPMSKEDLHAHVVAEHGQDTRFCTCQHSDLTLDDLLEFLLSKGKLVEVNGKLATNAERVCNH